MNYSIWIGNHILYLLTLVTALSSIPSRGGDSKPKNDCQGIKNLFHSWQKEWTANNISPFRLLFRSLLGWKKNISWIKSVFFHCHLSQNTDDRKNVHKLLTAIQTFYRLHIKSRRFYSMLEGISRSWLAYQKTWWDSELHHFEKYIPVKIGQNMFFTGIQTLIHIDPTMLHFQKLKQSVSKVKKMGCAGGDTVCLCYISCLSPIEVMDLVISISQFRPQ